MKHVFVCLFSFFVLFVDAQVPCDFGSANGYACENIDLWAHIPPSEWGGASTNETWGWTDPLDQREYVILGLSSGVRFYAIDNPAVPEYIGFLPTHSTSSLWRTFRVYQNYLFVGSEANNHGLQVFDLTRLRNPEVVPSTFTEDAHYTGFSRCHTLAIHEESGLLFACGTNTYSGGLHVVDINNPLFPVIAGGYSDDGYTHEAQVVTYNGPDPDYQGDIIVFCYNGNNPASLTIVNATDPSDIQTISITNYPGGVYCHQGWLTPDSRYLYMNDELDEYNGLQDQTRTLIWDMLDLDAPIYMGDFIGPTSAVDHNLYIEGNLCMQSNYTAGFRVLDIRNTSSLNISEVAFFDHFPANDNPVFQGNWMNYPYFDSGVIPLTDINNGLFLVEINFLHVAPTVVNVPASEQAYYDVLLSAGFEGPITLSVEGLPEDFVVNFNSNNVESPSNNVLSIASSAEAEGEYLFEVVATGAHFTYRRKASIVVVPEITYCPDLDMNGVVGANDLMIFQDNWACSGSCIADINGDGNVNINDMQILLAAYATFCSP